MDSGAQRLQQLLAAVGEPSRFQIVLELARRERHVSDLAGTVGLSQSCTTRHLQALERAGVVRTQRAGKRVMAALALLEPEVARLLQWLRDAMELDAYAQPGRTGGTEARRDLPQDAPPRQARRRRTADPGARARAQSPRRAGAAPALARGVPAGPERPIREDRPHGAPGASDTPPSDPRESSGSPRQRPDDLEDFLL
jgi:DNA-binding transcriptional ArsR family regulator